MPSKADRERRKAILAELAGRARTQALEAMPLQRTELLELLDYLDAALEEGCDHTLKFTDEFLRSRDLPMAIIVPWLGNQGGFCDCEVLANVGQELEE